MLGKLTAYDLLFDGGYFALTAKQNHLIFFLSAQNHYIVTNIFFSLKMFASGYCRQMTL